ncbi:MAG: hypothetical protein AB7I48_27625, partial [Planctomycetaceae bacterium]
GDVGVRIDSADGVSLSIGSFTSAAPEFTLRLPRGRHTMLLRVDTRERHSATLRLELFHVSGSPSEFEVVDGA